MSDPTTTAAPEAHTTTTPAPAPAPAAPEPPSTARDMHGHSISIGSKVLVGFEVSGFGGPDAAGNVPAVLTPLEAPAGTAPGVKPPAISGLSAGQVESEHAHPLHSFRLPHWLRGI